MIKADDENKGSFPPWTRLPSLEEMAGEAGINGAEFLKHIQKGCDIEKLAEIFDVHPETVQSLYEHFMKYGVGSVMGGD